MASSPDPSSTEVLRLVAEIRQMDQLIYRMGQCQGWAQMAPIFRELHDRTTGRMEAESRRIQAVLIPEIRKAHLESAPSPTPTITYNPKKD